MSNTSFPCQIAERTGSGKVESHTFLTLTRQDPPSKVAKWSPHPPHHYYHHHHHQEPQPQHHQPEPTLGGCQVVLFFTILIIIISLIIIRITIIRSISHSIIINNRTHPRWLPSSPPPPPRTESAPNPVQISPLRPKCLGFEKK